MGARRLSFLALLLYLSLDFANPLMAGAVCFDPDRSVEGVARARALAPAAVAVGPAVLPTTFHVEPAAMMRFVLAWPGVRPGASLRPRARATLSTPPESSIDDH